MLESNLSFAPDMQVILFRHDVNYYGNETKEELGRFLVPVSSLTNLYTTPQFYNLLDSEGNL